MPVYSYRGVDVAGKKARGHLDAENPRSARAKLRRDGVFVTEFEETSAEAAQRASDGPRFNINVSFAMFQSIGALDLAMMTRQLATLIGAGIPLVDGLGALTEQTEHPRLKAVLGQVRDRVNQGSSLADAMGRLLQDSELGQRLAQKGREVVAERFDSRYWHKEFVSLFESAG